MEQLWAHGFIPYFYLSKLSFLSNPYWPKVMLLSVLRSNTKQTAHWLEIFLTYHLSEWLESSRTALFMRDRQGDCPGG